MEKKNKSDIELGIELINVYMAHTLGVIRSENISVDLLVWLATHDGTPTLINMLKQANVEYTVEKEKISESRKPRIWTSLPNNAPFHVQMQPWMVTSNWKQKFKERFPFAHISPEFQKCVGGVAGIQRSGEYTERFVYFSMQNFELNEHSVRLHMGGLKVCPATFPDLLAFLETYPNECRNESIAALGTTFEQRRAGFHDAEKYFAHVHLLKSNSSNIVGFDLNKNYSPFNPNTIFLAKFSNRT